MTQSRLTIKVLIVYQFLQVIYRDSPDEADSGETVAGDDLAVEVGAQLGRTF
jgi:hypothetical protein